MTDELFYLKKTKQNKIMDTEYKVGALCDLIAKKKKKKDTKKTIEITNSNCIDENIGCQQELETNIESKNENVEKVLDSNSHEDNIEKESRTLFVGNVPVKVKMSAIKNLFKQFGVIESTRLRSVAVNNLKVPKRVSIMKNDLNSVKDTANVYIRFKTIEQAKSALVLNATKFEGHILRVDMALNTGHKENKKKGIFIGNLPFNIQENEIWDFFKDCGPISAVRIIRDNMTCIGKGFGYVDFETKESVELAIQLHNKKIKNREIRIQRINTKTPKTMHKQKFNKKTKSTEEKNKLNFQGFTPKIHKKKQKLTKTDLMRKKISKKLNV